MGKKLLALLFSLLLAFSFPGCGAKEENPTEAPETEPESLKEIADRNGTIIGRIDSRANATASDAGIFYSVFAPGENQFTADAEYRFFRMEDGKDFRLGTLHDQGYEAFYARTELGGIMYALAVAGNPMDDKNDPLWLLAFDPMKETMSRYLVTENGFPYVAMTSFNGKILLMNHEQSEKGGDVIYEFDPGTQKVCEVLSFDGKNDSLRSLYGAEEGLYVLRLDLRDSQTHELCLDLYDRSYKPVSSLKLNEMLTKAALGVHGITTPGDAQNEFGMLVSGFAVREGRYLYYENFALLRTVVNLETGEVLFAQDDYYSMSHGSGERVFHRINFAEEGKEEIEILFFHGGEVTPATFTPPDSRTLLRQVSVSPGGTWALELSEGSPRDGGTPLICLWKE
ncbi:MAG: hypothetical protein IKG97_05030 [Lachnospiraceae bacterium]|nr:hypothetical protein [Lachnospiraceae bacterium]